MLFFLLILLINFDFFLLSQNFWFNLIIEKIKQNEKSKRSKKNKNNNSDEDYKDDDDNDDNGEEEINFT